MIDFARVVILFTIVSVASVASLAAAPVAHASEAGSRWWLQGDLSFGYQRIEPTLNSEIAKDGQLLGGRLMAEYRHATRGAFGLGVGMQQTWQDGETDTRVQQYILRSLVVDGSYLYPLGSKFFWVGWLLRTQTGEGGRFDFSDIESVQTLITTGPQLRLNFEAKNWDWVIGASAQMALNSTDRKLFNIPVFVGLSIPLGDEERAPIAAAAVPAPVPVVAAPEAPPAPVKVEFDSRLITFDLNKAVLKEESKVFLTKVGRILKEQDGNWRTIAISGHTDVTGSAKRNKALSDERARAVMDWLVREGVPADRLSAVGHGAEQLLPSAPANSERQRRVELLFEGVLDGVKINDAMSALKSQK